MTTGSDELARFVEHARQKGMDLPTIRRLLLSQGWKEGEIAEVFCAHELDLPIPTRSVTSSARESFMYLLAFSGLYTWVISLIVLLFAYINRALPDPAWDDLWRQEFRNSTIRSAMAAIVVAAPLFLFLWRSLMRSIARHPERAQCAVRRWLLYLSLFIGAVTLVSDVITLLYYFFDGELSLRFALKVVTVFVLVGSVFVYVMLTLKSDAERAT